MLGELLRSIGSARDTTRLFAALGYTSDIQPLDDRTWIVARWRAFQVVACDATDPKSGARVLATRLAASSRRALAAAVGSGELALAAPRLGASGSTPVRRISLLSPAPGASQFLETLRPGAASSALALSIRLGELLSMEGVGERFFVAFRQVLNRMTAALESRGSEAERRTAALLPLTRILFLYFIQAKGWLDGRSDYLRRLLDASLARGNHFHRSALDPLFFGTLNRPHTARSGVAHLGAVPYLNGGLFEPHPIERRIGPVVFANELWRDAFDLLFERFRFCVREADEADAIAPDMLGRVFERVMDSSDRHDTGTFYTPEAVVRQVVEAAIDAALRDRLSPADARRLLDREPPSAHHAPPGPAAGMAIRALRILDPAVGSGAFLLGALERLTELHLAADPGCERHLPRIRRAILAENLFGVDLSPLAVRLAELRLWLAVIADDPATAIAEIAPLPNLDGVVRQGDSLLDPIGAARACNAWPHVGPTALARAVSSARRALFDASGKSLLEATRKLREREVSLADALIQGAFTSIGRHLRELVSAARSPDLFGRSTGLSLRQRQRYRDLLRHRSTLRRARAALADGQVPFFAFEVHAPDVTTAGGFSVVVGNPPWVRSERLAPSLRQTLRDRFGWWRGSAGRGYAHLPDLSVAFLERAVELAAPGGVVALLVPSKIASAGYAETARQRMVAETRIEYLHRVPPRDALGFKATIYPLAVVLKKAVPAATDRVGLGFHGRDTLVQSRLAGPGPWILVPDHDRDALEQLRSAGRPLREIATPAIGVKTGADDLFIGSLVERHGAIARLRLPAGDVNVEWDILRPAIRGRDVGPFAFQLRKALIWTHDAGGSAKEALPALATAHFGGHESRLRARADYRAGPIWTVFRVARHHTSVVVWRDIARRPAAAVLDACGIPRAIPLNTCYTVSLADSDVALTVAAVFNSIWCAALAWVTADEAQAGYRRINARVASAFPIPTAGPATSRLVSLSRQAHGNGDLDPGELDDAVADALDLTAGVRRSVRSLAANHG